MHAPARWTARALQRELAAQSQVAANPKRCTTGVRQRGVNDFTTSTPGGAINVFNYQLQANITDH
jgi:hypothetical protein